MLMLAVTCAIVAAVFAPAALARDEPPKGDTKSETTGTLEYEKITLQEFEEMERGEAEVDRETGEVVSAKEAAELPLTGGPPLPLLAGAALVMAGGLMGFAASGRTGAHRGKSAR